jgi:hypothetical protein
MTFRKLTFYWLRSGSVVVGLISMVDSTTDVDGGADDDDEDDVGLRS